MNTFKELIDKLYNENLKIVAETKNDFDLYNRFKNYMNRQYGRYLDRIEAVPEIAQTFIQEWYNTEIRLWSTLSIDDKYSRFTPDMIFLKIDELSSNILTIAIDKVKSRTVNLIDIEIAKDSLNKMKELSSKVLEENSKVVQKLISESTVEVNYICGNTKNISYRMLNLLRYSN